jgi:pyruvate/2-oxoacid:ferredoxin oxidoreductase beta subunit
MLVWRHQHGEGGLAMDKFSLFVPNFLPCKEYFVPEKNPACPGCGLALAIRQTYKALEADIEKAEWLKAGEGKLFAKLFDKSPVGNSEPSLMRIKKTGGELIICFDNEASGSLEDAVKKAMPAIAVAEGFHYVATASPSYPFDLYEKVKRGQEAPGKAYIHMLCPCPVGWQFDPELTVKIGRWAVESRAFPLYEVGSASAYHQTIATAKPRPLADYLKPQYRFADISEQQITELSAAVESDYKKLIDKIQPE